MAQRPDLSSSLRSRRAEHLRELIRQMGVIHDSVELDVDNAARSILDIDQQIADTMRRNDFPMDHFGFPLAANLLP